MSMSKLEIIQRCKIKLTEVKQSATRKVEDDINAALAWLGEEEIRIQKEALTNGTLSARITDNEVGSVLVEETTKGVPDRE